MQISTRVTLLSAVMSLQLISFVLSIEGDELIEPIVSVHGGAGDIPDSRDNGKLVGCRRATLLGYEKLMATGSVLDAVEEAVRNMEMNPYFNSGYGCVLDCTGHIEMDASIMNGSNLNAGCCTMVKDIYHPISLAKAIMLQNQTFLGGPNVMQFAREQGFHILPPGSLVTEFSIQALEEYKMKHPTCMGAFDKTKNKSRNDEVGTVGAVAIDQFGNVAAATSTGGVTGKLPGRIGDSPVLGAGTYADNASGAVSVTGHGETILRYSVAQRILHRIEFLGEDAQTATEIVLRGMTERLPHTAGAITLDNNGNIGIAFVSNKMAWAYRKGDELHSGIRPGDDFVEDV